MNERTRTNITAKLLKYSLAHKTETPMRDCFVEKYGYNITKQALLVVWDDWCKVARMAGVSNVARRGTEWTENGILIRKGSAIQ